MQKRKKFLITLSLLATFNIYAGDFDLFKILSSANECYNKTVDEFLLGKRFECINMIPDSLYENIDTLFIIENVDFVFQRYEMNLMTNSYNYKLNVKEDNLIIEKFESLHFDLEDKNSRWNDCTCIKDTFLYDYNKAVFWSENGERTLLDDFSTLICTLIERHNTDIYLDRLYFDRGWIHVRLKNMFNHKWYPWLYEK
ncbi:MAG: hypothetical protein U0K66_01615 [Paludibacteraceae bacterium]|jgi:hypothetical protein|nr:hypothetical protein [Paludibacteraceae bacterium]